jgi:hypothetical protein
VTVQAAENGVEGPPRIFLEAGYTYRGKRLTARPRTFFVALRSMSRERRFERVNSFIALVDGRRLSLKPLRRVTVGFYSEELEGEISGRELLKLAAARKVEVQAGAVEFELSPSAIDALSALARSAEPVRPRAR